MQSLDTIHHYLRTHSDEIGKRILGSYPALRLGFLGRVIHGTNPRAWLKEVRKRVLPVALDEAAQGTVPRALSEHCSPIGKEQWDRNSAAEG
jgi:hypothetical protein